MGAHFCSNSSRQAREGGSLTWAPLFGGTSKRRSVPDIGPLFVAVDEWPETRDLQSSPGACIEHLRDYGCVSQILIVTP